MLASFAEFRFVQGNWNARISSVKNALGVSLNTLGFLLLGGVERWWPCQPRAGSSAAGRACDCPWSPPRRRAPHGLPPPGPRCIDSSRPSWPSWAPDGGPGTSPSTFQGATVERRTDGCSYCDARRIGGGLVRWSTHRLGIRRCGSRGERPGGGRGRGYAPRGCAPGLSGGPAAGRPDTTGPRPRSARTAPTATKRHARAGLRADQHESITAPPNASLNRVAGLARVGT
jgi:hypothetical protein